MLHLDYDFDHDVDLADFGHFQTCLTGSGITQDDPGFHDTRLDDNDDVDPFDLAILLGCMNCANVPVTPTCAD